MNTNIFESGSSGRSRFVSINLNQDNLVHLCPFLSDNNEKILFSLTCNYLSLGQFELARSTIFQLSLINFRKVSELLYSIIYYGPPPDWQLSVTIPTSAHFVLACIKEYELFFRNRANIEDYIISRTEFDLLIGQMIIDSFDININLDIIKKLRYFYCFAFLINGLEVKVPELRILPKMVGLPPYLNRFPSFSTNLNKLFENLSVDKTKKEEAYFSVKIISEMFECFETSRSHFIQIAKLLTDCLNISKFEIGSLKSNSSLKNTLSAINTSLNWILLKNCILDLIFFKENHRTISTISLVKMISKSISILRLENIFENHDLDSKNFLYKENIPFNTHFTEPKEPEDVISIIVAIFCIINLFCKYDLRKEIFVKFLIDQIKSLKACEEICNICAIESKVLLNVKNLFSEDIVKKLNNFQIIHQYLNNLNTINLVENGEYNDNIGMLVDSNLDQSLISKIVLKFDNFLFNINFGINNYLGIFSLPKYIENKNKVILYPIVIDDFSIHYKFDENPIFWCEYLRYLNLSRNKFEELPIIFVSNLLNKINQNKSDNYFEAANKIILCFPHLRAICVFLGLKNDPVFNWKLIKNLWLPFRSIKNEKVFTESEILANNLDEISRKHAISIFISEKLNSNYSNEFRCYSDKNTKTIFEEIILKKSIISYYFDNFRHSKNYTTICWTSLEKFITSLISLPLTIGNDILLLTKERDCIKSYLLQKEVFKIIDGKENSSFGLNLQNISIEIGNIQTNYFHNELIYCFFCQSFIYLRKIKISNSLIQSSNKRFFFITQLLYYLLIWSNRLSKNFQIEMLQVIEKTFEKTILMIELILFSFPFKIPNVLPKNFEIFTWWYRFILSIPSKVFNTGKTLISYSQSSEYFHSLFHNRWVLRETYENNPWYSNSLSFESFCVLNNYNDSTSESYSDILLSSPILMLKLLSIQNYEKSNELILNSNFSINVTLIALDGFVFHALFVEENDNNYYSINTVYRIVKNINEGFPNIDILSFNQLSLFSVLETFFPFIEIKLIDCENEIAWLLQVFSKLYFAFLLIDFSISFGNKNVNISLEQIGKAKNIIEENTSNLDIKYNTVVQTTLSRLLIFYHSSSTISLTRYIMEIDTLPQQTSLIKTHLNRIHDRKLITTALTHSLNYLSGFSLNKSKSENLININQILEQNLFSNVNNTGYLFSVLHYIKSIISVLFLNFDKHKAFPILALTPNEIISYSFFERKLNVGSNELSQIMRADLISVVIKTLNCLYSSILIFKNTEINSYNEMEFLINQFYPFKGTFTIVIHNILPSGNAEYSYSTWNFVLENQINHILTKKQILLTSLKYRIWKYNINRKLEYKLSNMNIDKISGFYFSKSLEYFNYLFKWLSIIDTFFFLNDDNLYIIKNFEKKIGLINYLFSISFVNRVNTVDKIVFKLSRKILKNKNIIHNLNLINFKKIIKLNSPYNIYKLITEIQPISDPNFVLSIVEIAYKNTMKYSYSWFKNSKTNKKRKFIEENIVIILIIQRLFCISYIKRFKNNTSLWNKWCILIKEWKSTKGIVLLLNCLLEAKFFNIAKLVSQKLLLKVIEYDRDIKYSEKESITNIFSGYKFFEEVKRNTHYNNFSLVSNINNIIANMQDDYNFQELNISKLYKLIISKNISSFENIRRLLISNTGIIEKYKILDAYINSPSSLLDMNRVSVLKTILTSLKLVRDLGIKNIQVSNLFSPYLIIRLAIMTRNNKLIEILKRDIDIFLKSDVLLYLIEESFGIVENKQFIIEKIKTSFIFGQADINMCLQLFQTIENQIELNLNVEETQSYNIDVYFSIKLISIIPKKKTINDLLLNIFDKMSNQLYKIFKKSMPDQSLIRPRFECSNSQLWVTEEGSLKTISENLHPFSKFSSARKNSYYTKNRYMNVYKCGSNLGEKRGLSVKNELNMENISKSRVLFRNLFVLLTWASDYIGKNEFNVAIRSLSYLLEIWQRIPGIVFSLKDIVFLNKNIIQILIFSDQLNLLKDLSKNNFLESTTKIKNLESGNSIVHNIVADSIIINKINQLYNGKKNHMDSITLNTSRSRNEIIMEIFCSKWNVNKGKIVKIENPMNDSMRIIENIMLSKPDILNLNILIIVLTYHSWKKLQICTGGRENYILRFPLSLLFNSDIFSPILLELYERTFISSIKIRRNAINGLPDFVFNLNNLSVGIENNSDFFTNSNDNLSSSYTTFFLERITNSIKNNIFTRDTQKSRIIKCIQVKKPNITLIYYNQKSNNKKKFFQFDLINHLLTQNIPNHYLTINTFVKLNFWWEAMVYILRWSFELGASKSRSLLTEKKGELQTNSEQNFEGLFFDLVIKNAHYKNQLNCLISAMNEAVPLGGPRASIFVKKCKHIIQKYLESNGALEMLYMSFLSLSVSIEIPHAIIGAIAIHLSLLNHLNIDSRTGYLESALYHFKNAELILKKKVKSGVNKKNNKQGFPTINYHNSEKTLENPSTSQSLTNSGKLNDILIPFIADIPIYKINTTPWGGLSLLSIEKIIKLLELQNSIIKLLLRENARKSILSPNYKDRRDTIVILFLIREYSLAFKVSSALEVPLMEVLVHATKELIVSYPESKSLSYFLDSMKLWLSEYDSDALISNAINMWISEKKINLNNISVLEKNSVSELVNKLSNPLGRSEAFNMINPLNKVRIG
ncbi:uncharacterized protein cubi_02334 [Cryptosporidium ubiquitum]|uniref:Uncharacterized protein n=1 Tax=Cryptosporidium ubiquitum TaxID=857276 RepID=A0A1J4MGG2_9CRYT|nr:uncharacterized protein cubi_02334 [Cryptosporidium ubiquitum]OII73103.1 hypothetical protein cubi_02334 [Cryptosporidium ubiquitum]